jgi:hypothetical protein
MERDRERSKSSVVADGFISAVNGGPFASIPNGGLSLPSASLSLSLFLSLSLSVSDASYSEEKRRTTREHELLLFAWLCTWTQNEGSRLEGPCSNIFQRK